MDSIKQNIKQNIKQIFLIIPCLYRWTDQAQALIGVGFFVKQPSSWQFHLYFIAIVNKSPCSRSLLSVCQLLFFSLSLSAVVVWQYGDDEVVG